MVDENTETAVEDGETRADLRALVVELADLLDFARCGSIDPGLRRSWGQRRRRALDRAELLAGWRR